MKAFNLEIEFSRCKLHQKIEECISNHEKGYVCFVDANVLSVARKNNEYLSVLQRAMINSCDGGSIAAMINVIHRTKVRAYNGPDLFENYIGKSNYKQLLLGNTEVKFQMIVKELKRRGLPSDHILHLPVPFAKVEEFDYEDIAKKVDDIDADIIWVSLGAPKQERVMSKLLPYINRGVLLGIGAAINFYIGENNQPKIHLGAFRFIWIDRVFREPKKQLKRVWNTIKVYPCLCWEEYKRYNK